MKKLLILGGSYFIGKWTVERLKMEFETYVLNRGSKPIFDPYVKSLVCDRNNLEQMKSVLKGIRFDYVIDISGLNQLQSEILLQSLDLDHIKKLIYISSSAVYHIESLKTPFKETDLLGGISPFESYARHKIEAETYLKEMFSPKQLWIFRPPIVYGEDNYVLRERLIFKMLELGQTIYVPKTNNRIQFVYVRDLAEHMAEALLGQLPPAVYNVGQIEAPTFSRWIEMCAETVGVKAKYLLIDQVKYEITARSFFPFFDYDNILDVSKINTYSKVETPMKVGLERAYQDYLAIKDEIVIPEAMIKAYDILNHKKNG